MSYAPYPAYKDSGVPWLGQVPEGWEVRRLKTTADTVRNGIWGSEPDGEDDIACIRVADFDRQSFRVGEEKLTLRSVKPSERKGRLLKSGDLLIEKSGGGDKQLVGAIVSYDLKRDAVCSNFVAKVEVNRSHNPRFLTYLHAHLYAGRVNYRSIKQTTGIQNLDSQLYFDELVAIPEIQAQTAIADFLDKKTAEIDDLIAKKEELLRLLAEKRTALITHAVTKGLNPNAPMKPSGIDWLGDVPEGWDVVPFKWCCQVQSGQVDPKLDEYKRLPLIAPDHIESGTGRLLPYESAEEQGAISGKYQFEAGEILYSKIRPELSKVALAPEAGLCSADMYAIRAMEGLRPEFLFFQMLSRHFHRFAVLESMRVAMPKINREGLGIFPVMVPDEDTQGKILDHIQSELSKMDLAEEKITTARDYLKEYRSAVITNAVTGKIKVA